MRKGFTRIFLTPSGLKMREEELKLFSLMSKEDSAFFSSSWLTLWVALKSDCSFLLCWLSASSSSLKSHCLF